MVTIVGLEELNDFMEWNIFKTKSILQKYVLEI
jgi:hypothetical protein